MPTYKVMIAQFPGFNVTQIRVSNWVTNTVVAMCQDPTIGIENVTMWDKADTPVDMVRNQALAAAEKDGIDYVLMLDNDMDLHPGFWATAWDFVRGHRGPCVIAAPYCGPPPDEEVHVFQFQTRQGDNPNPDIQLVRYSRPEAERMTGITRVAALPTGCMLIDMNAVRQLDKAKGDWPGPRFYYEWVGDGPLCSHCHQRRPGPRLFKHSTEDGTFSRDLYYAGIPLYCTWDLWAGHYKTKRVGKPQSPKPEEVPAMFRKWGAQAPGGPIEKNP